MAKRKKGEAVFDGYTAGWYDFDTEEVCFSFWENGERMARSFVYDWHFFLAKDEIEEATRIELFDRAVDHVEIEGGYAKIYMPYYNGLRKDLIAIMQDVGLHPLEGDVHPVDRYLYDHNLKLNDNPKILYYDLETDTSDGGWDHIERHQLLSVAYGPSLDKMECITIREDSCGSEEKLLEKFLKVVADYDVLIGWNSQNYDEVVLKARAKKYRLWPNWKMVNHLDLMLLFKQYYMRDETGSGVRISFSLDNIAQTVLGEGKVEGLDKHRMREMLETRPAEVIRYNKRDVEIMIELEAKLGYISAHTVLAHICNRFLSDYALRSSYLVDGFVLKHASQVAKFHFGMKGKFQDENDERKSIAGAHVMEPILGLHKGVCDIDFSALYPSIVISFNISPETKVCMIKEFLKNSNGVHPTELGNFSVAANGAVYRTDVEGIFPAISKIALSHRQTFKDEAKRLEEDGEGSIAHRRAVQSSNAWKVLANSMYGVLASKFARYSDLESGEAITSTGKVLLLRVAALAEKNGIPVVYGDTDSNFLICTVAVANEFCELVVIDCMEYFRSRGAREGWLSIKLDAEFTRLILVAKKRYFGKKANGKWDVRGLELIRSDNCRYSREMQRRLITYLLEAANPNPKMAKRLVEKWALPLFEKEVGTDDLFLAQSLNQPLAAYAQETVHVRIAKDLLRRGLEVYQGMKIPYVITGRADGKLQAVHVDDFEGEYDASLYWKAKVFPATERILNLVWPDNKFEWKELYSYQFGGPKQKDLFVATPKKDPVTIVLDEREADKLKVIRKVVEEFPGDHPLELEIQLEDGGVGIMSDIRVRFVPELVIELEKVTGRRIYFGSENWDQ